MTQPPPAAWGFRPKEDIRSTSGGKAFSRAMQPWPSVQEAGSGTAPMIEADDAIDTAALRYPRDPKRRYRPFALCVGFVAPHFPFVVPEPYFSRYYPHNVDMPGDPPGHLDNLPPAANRLREAFGFHGYSDDDIARARAAYYGLITTSMTRSGEPPRVQRSSSFASVRICLAVCRVPCPRGCGWRWAAARPRKFPSGWTITRRTTAW